MVRGTDVGRCKAASHRVVGRCLLDLTVGHHSHCRPTSATGSPEMRQTVVRSISNCPQQRRDGVSTLGPHNQLDYLRRIET